MTLVTVSNIHGTGNREGLPTMDQPMKRPDSGSVLVRSLKDRNGTLGGLRTFYLQKLRGGIHSGRNLEREGAICMRVQLVGNAAERQHGAYTGQTSGTTTSFHAVDDKLVGNTFNASRASRDACLAAVIIPLQLPLPDQASPQPVKVELVEALGVSITN
jgi:hypothetical protein